MESKSVVKRKAIQKGTSGSESELNDGVRGDDNPHPETKLEGKRCITCGKFFFTDIASDKCINCIPDRMT